MAYGDACPYCNIWGCSPTCPGPEDSGTCPGCGGGAPIHNGRLECSSCGHGHEPGSMFDTDPESLNNRRFAH